MNSVTNDAICELMTQAYNETKIRENIVEIARTVQYFISIGEIDIDDNSKQLNSRIVMWAEEFEKQNKDVDYDGGFSPEGEPRDYRAEIDKFTLDKIKEFYVA